MKRAGTKLEDLIHQVDDLISKAATENLRDTVHLLKMVRLDLQTQLYGITDEELRQITDRARDQLTEIESLAGEPRPRRLQ